VTIEEAATLLSRERVRQSSVTRDSSGIQLGAKGETMKICESIVTIKQEKGRYVLNCLDLGIASIGLTLPTAIDNLKVVLKYYYDPAKEPDIEEKVEKELESWKNLLLC